MSVNATTEANRKTIDRLTNALDKYLDPSDCQKSGSNTRRLLDSLKAKGVRLSDLLGVVTAIDGITPAVTSGALGPGNTFQSFEFLAPLVGKLNADTGLKEVQAHLAGCVDRLKKGCPGLVKGYQAQF